MDKIIVLIVIGIINSFFNKDKKQKKTVRRPVRLESKTPNIDSEQISKIEVEQKQAKVPPQNMWDVIRELSTDFNTVFNQKPIKQMGLDTNKGAADPINFGQEPDYDRQENDNRKKESLVRQKTVYSDEIGDQSSSFNPVFNGEAVLQGIIMSEILAKPKALR